MNDEAQKRQDERRRDAQTWQDYRERLDAYRRGELPMPPEKPVRYPFR